MSRSERILELEKLLKNASEAYYNSDSSIMSDAEYDSLREELENLDPENVFLSQVGSPSDNSLQKVKLTIPMGSLHKVNTEKEYQTWLNSTVVPVTGNSVKFAVQPKFDGSSIEIMYRNGKFFRAVTRGDGFEGDDVTHAIKKARGIPKTISLSSGDVFVRGESILKISDWEKYFKPDGDKNPRNSSNGTTRRLDGDKSQYLNFKAFNLINQNTEYDSFETKMQILKQLGFDEVPTEIVDSSEVSSVIEKWQKKRDSYEFEIDGMVVKVNNEKDQKRLGENNNRPYWARAWKFPPMGGHSSISSITWDVGTRGTITPVAVISPIEVGGVTITNITLHNMDEIERKDIHIGDEVEVIRAGDVIPYIVRVVTKGINRKNISISECPGCKGKVERDGPFLKCCNPSQCPGTQSKRIKAYIAKRDIKFLGDSNLGSLLEKGIVKNIIDLYFLTRPALVGAGVGEKMSDKILEEIKKSMDVDFADLVGSLSLDLLGRRQAKKIVEAGFISLDQWKNLKPSDLVKHEGFQDTKSNRIVDSLRENWDLVEKLANILNVTYFCARKVANTNSKLNNKSFCFTGAMNKSRKELQSLVEDNGGINKDDVNKDLDFLVIEDVNSESSKAKKARKLGTQLLSEEDFLKMVK